MKLFLLENNDNSGWEVTNGFVIAARDETRAREIAGGNTRGEYRGAYDYWTHGASCRQIAARTTEKEGIVLHDFETG